MTVNEFDKLSIVIPVGPDDKAWQQLLLELTALGNKVEIIISACQAQPIDFDLTENVIWLESIQGRASQLNRGASQACSDFIWFLHADTRFTENVCQVVHRYIAVGKQSMGYFRLKFASDGPEQTRLNAWAANIRSRYFGLPFGDQGFIMNRSVFQQLKGFDETVALGEDLDFVVRVKASGIKLQELPAELLTSARRYQQYGWLQTTTRHVWLTWRLTRQAKRRLAYS